MRANIRPEYSCSKLRSFIFGLYAVTNHLIRLRLSCMTRVMNTMPNSSALRPGVIHCSVVDHT